MLQHTNGQPYEMSFAYDLAGHQTSETYPSGRIITTAYDGAGREQSVNGQMSGAGKTYASGMTYAAQGAISAMQLGNGLWEHTGFNNRLQPSQIGLGATSADSNKLQIDYSYGTSNNNGNVQSQTVTFPGLSLAQSYSYDALNRLLVAQEQSGTSWKQTLIYDRYGNRNFDAANTTQNVLAANPVINPANNRITPQAGEYYRYDAAGNLDRDIVNNAFTYDGENRQTSYAGGSASGGANYYYDGEGHRIGKVTPSSITIYVYDVAGQMVAEYTNTTPQGTGGTSYLTSDTLGTPRVITDQSGNIKARHDYLPFGEEVSAGTGGRTAAQGYSQFDGLRFRYTSKERDDETGLDYFGARYYSSPQGRFTSVDPYNIILETQSIAEINPEKAQAQFLNYLSQPQQWNRYAYVANNPLRYVDPTGELLELTGNEEDRKRGFQRIKDLVGERAAGLLYVREQNGHYYVDYRGKPGDGDRLAARGGELGVFVANIIDSNKTVEFRVATSFDTKYEKGVFTASGRCGGGCTVGAEESLTGNTQIFVHPDAGNITQLAFNTPTNQAYKVSPPGQLDFFNDIDDAHEFGHAYANAIEGLPIRNSGATNARSLQLENYVRERRGLSRRRTGH